MIVKCVFDCRLPGVIRVFIIHVQSSLAFVETACFINIEFNLNSVLYEDK